MTIARRLDLAWTRRLRLDPFLAQALLLSALLTTSQLGVSYIFTNFSSTPAWIPDNEARYNFGGIGFIRYAHVTTQILDQTVAPTPFTLLPSVKYKPHSKRIQCEAFTPYPPK
jgi:hypothetical protein